MFFHSKISGPPPYLPSPFSKIAEISEYHNIFTGDKPYDWKVAITVFVVALAPIRFFKHNQFEAIHRYFHLHILF